jgi:hypothetical protein
VVDEKIFAIRALQPFYDLNIINNKNDMGIARTSVFAFQFCKKCPIPT